MAATSPYTQNDYQAVSSFRPYQLPINDIFKALSAQNAFWDQGAARVRNMYDNVLGLKLSKEENGSIRDNFMRDAEKQLTKLSAMDLSDPSVQRQGLNIFKPLFQDEGIVSDDAATRHIERVNSDALSYRNKDGGKNYSQFNHQYAMMGSQEFLTSADRMAGKQYLSKKKEYEPYYDYTEDFAKALKDCKPSEAITQSPNYSGTEMTGYQKYDRNKGLAASQARVCLEAGMSAKGLRQMQIEGVVNYANNKDVLASDTVSYLSTVSRNYSDQMQDLSARRTSIRESKTLSDADKKAALAALDEDLKGLGDEVVRNNTIISKLNKGDYTPLDENMEAYAGSVYSFRKLMKKAQASQWQESEAKYVDDPVQLAAKKYQQEVFLRDLDHRYDESMENLKFQHDTQLKVMDIMAEQAKAANDPTKAGKDPFKSGNAFIYDATTGTYKMNPNLQWETPNITDAPTKDANAYSEIQSELSTLNSQDQNNNIRLYNEIINKAEKDPEFQKELMTGFNAESWDQFKDMTKDNGMMGQGLKGIQNSTWFQTYFEQHKEDPLLNRWAEENANIQMGIKTLNRRVELGEQRVMSELGLKKSPGEAVLDSIKDLKPMTLNNGSVITPQEVASAFQGNTGRFQVREGSLVSNPYGPSTGREKEFWLDGKKLEGKDRQLALNLWTKVNEKNADVNRKIIEKRAEVYGKEGWNRDRWAMTYDDKSGLAENLQNRFAQTTDGGETKPNKGIVIVGSDFSGGMKINHPGVKKGGSEDIIAQYRAMGLGTDIEIPADNTVILRGTNYNVIPKAVDNPTMKKAAYHLGTVAASSDFIKTQEGARVTNSDIRVPVYISGKRQEISIETYKINNAPEYRVYIPGATDPSPKAIASNAYDLMEKIARMKLDFKQPIR